MARSKPSARDALSKLKEQRLKLDEEETKLRTQVAQDLGRLLLDCGAETLDPTHLKQLVRHTLNLGADEALKRLSAS
jgi:predicted component of type VI protein secretion system